MIQILLIQTIISRVRDARQRLVKAATPVNFETTEQIVPRGRIKFDNTQTSNGIHTHSKDSLCAIHYIISISKYKIDIIFFSIIRHQSLCKWTMTMTFICKLLLAWIACKNGEVYLKYFLLVLFTLWSQNETGIDVVSGMQWGLGSSPWWRFYHNCS